MHSILYFMWLHSVAYSISAAELLMHAHQWCNENIHFSLRSFFVIPFFYLHSLFWFTRNFSLLTDLRSSKKKTPQSLSWKLIFRHEFCVENSSIHIIYSSVESLCCVYTCTAATATNVFVCICALACHATQRKHSLAICWTHPMTIFSTKFISAYICHLVLMFMFIFFLILYYIILFNNLCICTRAHMYEEQLQSLTTYNNNSNNR